MGLERKLESLERPVKIIANNEDGLILRGAKGEILVLNNAYYLSQIAFKQGLEPGFVLIGKDENN